MSLKNSIKYITAATFDASTLTALYQPVNVGGLPHSCFELIINNFNTVGIIYSFDGVNDHNYMNPDQVLVLRGGNSASSPNNNCALFQLGTVLYVRSIAVGAGLVVLAGLYQPQGS